MFLIGYISSFSIAIILSVFYMGCAIQHISGTFKEEKKEIRLTEFFSSKEIPAFYSTACLTAEITDNKIKVFDVIEDFNFIALLEKIPKEEQNYSLFSRPPPFFYN